MSLLFDISEFMQSAAGVALFGVLIAVLFIVVIDLNYRFFTKLLLDFLFALVALIICSPVYAVCAVISKKRCGKVLESKAYLGIKGKIIYIHAFAGLNRGIRNLPRLLDVLCGKMSFVGVRLLEVRDGAFVDDEYLGRFAARPGLVNHLAIGGYEELTYEEAFALDKNYAKKRELFRDIYTVIKSGVFKIRGEGSSYMGETRQKSYTEALLKRGDITPSDAERAQKYADNAEDERKKAERFKKERYRK